MAISFGSINTGLPKDIVQKLIAAERVPIAQMQAKKDKINSKAALLNQLTSLVQNMKTAVSSNASANSLRELSAEFNKELVDVSIDKQAAQPGNYTFTVERLAKQSSAFTNGFESRDDTHVGVGYLEYYLPNGDSKEIYIDKENSTLDGIAKLINQDGGNGMSAVVVNDGSESDTPFRLIISLDDSGDINTAKFPDIYLVDGDEDLFIETEKKAQDAQVTINGMPVELSANIAADIIPGVTIDLKKAQPGEEFTISVNENITEVTGKVESIVNSINEVLLFIKQQNNLDQSSDTSRTLGGDLTLQTLESMIRRAVFRPIPTSEGPQRISRIGLQFQKDGLLKLDTNKLSAEMKRNYKFVSQVLTGGFKSGKGPQSSGFIDNMREVAARATRYPSGALSTRKSGLKSSIRQIDDQIDQKNRLLERKERMLKDKFARLESTISEIRGQSAGVAALGGGGVNPVQQLG